MSESPFKFSYQLPPQHYHNSWGQVFISGEYRSLIPPELRKKHQVADYSKYMNRPMFDGTPFFLFIEKYKEAFEFGAFDAYWFVDTGNYFDGEDKEWERLNTFWYSITRWEEVHHRGFTSGDENTIDLNKWNMFITLFLDEFPNNPRVINDYAEYLRLTKEPIMAFKIIKDLYEKYKEVGDFYINLESCYWAIQEFFEGSCVPGTSH